MEEKIYTEFGKFLSLTNTPYTTAAAELGVTRSYVSMLSTGKATPGLELAGEIEDWTNGQVTIRSWYEWIKAAKAAVQTPAE
jgi:hypothetical protein